MFKKSRISLLILIMMGKSTLSIAVFILLFVYDEDDMFGIFK